MNNMNPIEVEDIDKGLDVAKKLSLQHDEIFCLVKEKESNILMVIFGYPRTAYQVLLSAYRNGMSIRLAWAE